MSTEKTDKQMSPTYKEKYIEDTFDTLFRCSRRINSSTFGDSYIHQQIERIREILDTSSEELRDIKRSLIEWCDKEQTISGNVKNPEEGKYIVLHVQQVIFCIQAILNWEDES